MSETVKVTDLNNLIDNRRGVIALTSESNGYCRLDSYVHPSDRMPGLSYVDCEYGTLYFPTDSTVEIEEL